MLRRLRKNISTRKRFKLEPLEARTLYSADIMAASLAFEPTTDLIEPSNYTLGLNPANDLEQSVHRLELVFVDENTPGYLSLMEDLHRKRADTTTFEIIAINADEDGLARITSDLARYSNVDAMHLITHGSDGNVNIGNAVLNQRTFTTFESEIQSWGNAFTEEGDLLIYGCDFAASEQGRQLAKNISDLTTLDVAASDDATGNIPGRADWVLEQIEGRVETDVPFSQHLLDNYHRSLASQIQVSTTNDIVDGDTSSFDALYLNQGTDGAISLREAVMAANTQPGADTITLPPGAYALTLPGTFEDSSATGDLNIAGDITITGSSKTDTSISAAGLNDRLIEVHTGGNLTISNLTLQDGGSNSSGGGAIYNAGNLLANEVIMQNNTVINNAGGALWNSGVATLTNVDLINNTAIRSGGMHNEPGGTVEIDGATISGNEALNGSGGGVGNTGTFTLKNAGMFNNSGNSGGGLYHSDGDAYVFNSTFSGNTATFNGGGLYNDSGNGSYLAVSYSTITNNIATNNGAGLHTKSGTTESNNTIFSNNITAADIQGATISGGYNIVKNNAASWSGSTSMDMIGTDPLLQPLALNGGATATHAITAASPAYNSGDPLAALPTDQRGELRDVTPDIGAFELVTAAPINEPPQLTLSVSSINYTENSSLIVDNALLINDNDSIDLAGGVFTVSSTAFNEIADQVSIHSVGTGTGEIEADPSTVRYEGIAIGTWSGGAGSTALQVNLNNAATPEAVTALGQSIAFSIFSESPDSQTRTLEFSVSDGDGGTSNIGSVDIVVLPVNDAPVLDNSTVLPMAAQPEDVTSPAGTSVAALLSTTITDADNGAVEGIAVVNTDNSNGDWQYSIDSGTNWISFGPVSDTSATLLNGTTLLRFIPNTDYSGTSTINFRAWDQTDGLSNGVGSVNVASNGGSEAYSTSIAQATITTVEVNDPPLLSLDANSSSGATPNNYLTGFSTGGTPTLITDSDTSLSDVDSITMTQLTVVINTTPDGALESLAADLSSYSDFTQSYNNATSTLTLTAINGLLTDYESILKTITYDNASTTPDTTDRVLALTAIDHTGLTDVAQTTIQISSDITAPLIATNATSSVVEGGQELITPAELSSTDDLQPVSALNYSITTPPTSGIIANVSAPTVAITQFTQSMIDANQVTYVHNGNEQTTDQFEFSVDDSAGNSNTGNVFDIAVLPVNDSPVLIVPGMQTVNEDSTLQFGTATTNAISVSDLDATSALLTVSASSGTLSIIDSSGTLTINGSGTGSATIAGDISNINSALDELTYTPIADFNGADVLYIAIDDLGQSGSGGTKTDAAFINITVNPVNDAPDGQDNTLNTDEDIPLTLSPIDFGFTDVNDNNSFSGLEILTTPSSGQLLLDGIAVNAGSTISNTDLSVGKLSFVPTLDNSGANYASFRFLVKDDGGTSNGGLDQDQTFNTIIINVDAVNDAPSGTDAILHLTEDNTLTLSATDFGFTDASDNNTLSGVILTTEPTNGQLVQSGIALASGDFFTIDTLSPNVTFVPDANDSGTPYSIISFQVQDNGGTANGGSNTDPTPNFLTFNVTPVSDAPEGTDTVISVNEDTNHTFFLNDFGFTDPLDSNNPDQYYSLVIVQLPVTGTLLYNSQTVTSGQPITASDISLGLLQYQPSPNTFGQAFDNLTFLVTDTGSTANGGQNQDQTANTIVIDINSVSDAPAGSDITLTIIEDTPYTLLPTDFGFSDTIDGDNFAALTVTQLPANGTLTLNATAVTNDQMISITDIVNGLLVFTPQQNKNGISHSDFMFLVHDDGSTANTGLTISQAPNTLTFNVTPVSDAPEGTDNLITINEDNHHTFALPDFGLSDPLDANNPDQLLSLDITLLPTGGILLLNSLPVIIGQTVSETDIVAGALVYVPPAGESGIAIDDFSFSVTDTGNTANSGQIQDLTANIITFDIDPVSDAPTGTDATISIDESTSHTFSPINFGFNDPLDADNPDQLLSLDITQPPANGTLLLNGIAVVAAQTITATDIGAGLLIYTPPANASGTAFDSFLFKVADTGSTANGGLIQDATANSITFDINSVSNAPSGTDNTLTIIEDTPYPLLPADFGFSDSIDGDNFAALTVTQLHANGTLTLNGTAVTNNQVISITDIVNGLLVFTPLQDQNGTSYSNFMFLVHDDGSTANSGLTVDQTTNTLTFDVIPVSDAPEGSDNLITISEDTSHALSATDFGYSDTDDGDNFAALTVTQIPASGGLTLNGIAVTNNQMISITDIVNGLLAFTPEQNQSGISYSDMMFLVHDNGSTANGGQTIDQAQNTLIFDVTPVSDAPQGTDNLITVNEDSNHTFTLPDFGFSDPLDTNNPDQLLSLDVTQPPTGGTLLLSSLPVISGQTISKTDIVAGALVYVPPANAYGTAIDKFLFSVSDTGNTVNSGQTKDLTANTITFNINPVSDAPGGTNNTLNIIEDTSYTFNVTDFGFSDIYDNDNFAALTVTQTPANGTLTLNGTAVTDNQMISTTDIVNGLLVFTPQQDEYGASYSDFMFLVHDNGSTANAGLTISQAPNTLTFNVTPVSDAPEGTDNVIAINEDNSHTFALPDFGFSDPLDANDPELFLSLDITQPPTGGALLLNSQPVISGQTISAADIVAGTLIYVPPINDSGTALDNFLFAVTDTGNTANGGQIQDLTANTITFNITPISDAPGGTDNTLTISEDTPYVISASDFGYSDINDGDNFTALTVTQLPANGTLTLNATTITNNQMISITDIVNGLLVFTPQQDQNGVSYSDFMFLVHDDGNTSNGGQATSLTQNTLTFDVTSVSDAPDGADSVITINEDSSHTFSLIDFGFTDPLDISNPDHFLSLEITQSPTSGTLLLNNQPVLDGQSITASDITAGAMVYLPAPDSFGQAFDSLLFKVTDTGNIVDGGQIQDLSVNTIIIDISSVNDAPSGTDKTLNINEDTLYIFEAADFGFSDTSDGDNFAAITVTRAPLIGSLTLNAIAVTDNQQISMTDITSGLLIFTPQTDQFGPNHADLIFLVHDDSSSGNSVSHSHNTLKFNVRPVNDAPDGLDTTIQTAEDTPRVLNSADFGYTDPENDLLHNVIINTVPAFGSLLINGALVDSGDIISATSINNGDISYLPDSNSTSQDFIEFTVRDTGGISNDGADTDTSAARITIEVSAVNDAPTGSDKTILLDEDSNHTFSTLDFGYSDLADQHNLLEIKILAANGLGTLLLDGTAISTPVTVSSADISNGLLSFTTTQNTAGVNYATVDFHVRDSGGVSNGGVDLDPSANRLTIEVNSINDAPAGTNGTVTTLEDQPRPLNVSDFGFSDPDNNQLLTVNVVTLPTTGSIQLFGQSISAGYAIDANDILLGGLVYVPEPNSNGSTSFDFTVSDNGDSTGDSQNTDPTANTLQIVIASVNDEPVGSDSTITISEDTSHQFSLGDFPFNDPIDSDNFSEVVIITIPAEGILSNNGTALTPGDIVSATSISNGELLYFPEPNSSNSQQIVFQVRDNGTTQNGGIDTDSSPNTATIFINAVNDAPTATDQSISLNENTAYTLTIADFGFKDTDDSHAFLAIVIDTLPSDGSLLFYGDAISSGQNISSIDISNGSLVYHPAANEYGTAYSSLDFRVQDNGGTTMGGKDISLLQNRITFDVVGVNDAPAGTDKVISILEGANHRLNSADFGFTDNLENHVFTAITVSSIAHTGTLALDSQPVNAGDVISIAEINSGKLVYTPASDNLTQHFISFRVHDNGDTTLGNTIDQTENYLHFNITLVNEPPTLINAGTTLDEGSDSIISTTVLAAIDPDNGAEDLLFTIEQLPRHGQLTLDGNELLSGDGFTMAQLSQNRIHYIHNGSETSTDSFDFTLKDGSESGVTPITGRFAITVNEVIDPAPELQNNNFTVASGGSFDTIAGDALATGSETLLNQAMLGNEFYRIQIETQPKYGTITLRDDGTFIYTHDGSTSLNDYFEYRVINEDGASATAIVDITVVPLAAEANNEFVDLPQTAFKNQITQPDTTSTSEVIQNEKIKETSNETQIDPIPFIDATEFSDTRIGATIPIATDGINTIPGITDAYSTLTRPILIDRDLQVLEVRKHNQIETIDTIGDSITLSVRSAELLLEASLKPFDVINSKNFQQGLSRVQNDLDSAEQETLSRYQVANDVGVSISISTTAGVLAWMLRGGALFGSIMASTPLWSSIDPLKITGATKRSDDPEDQDHVEEIFQ